MKPPNEGLDLNEIIRISDLACPGLRERLEEQRDPVSREDIARVLSDEDPKDLFVLIEDHGTFAAKRRMLVTNEAVDLLVDWRGRFRAAGYEATVWKLWINGAMQDLGIEVDLCVKVNRIKTQEEETP